MRCRCPLDRRRVHGDLRGSEREKKKRGGREESLSLQNFLKEKGGSGDIQPTAILPRCFISLYRSLSLHVMASADDRLNIHAQLEHLQVLKQRERGRRRDD